MPSISHSFSVHLLNCYFPNFWYSNVSENGKERYTMRKKQDVIWETSTLWEQVCIHGVRYLVFLEKQVLSSEQDVGRAVQIDYFISTLEKMKSPITEFDERLWISMVDHVVVYSKTDIWVVYRDGMKNASLR